jgi:hypothetical protein
MASTKTWKDILLSSGMPLEHDVRQKLAALGAFQPREFIYERTSEGGLEKFFSVDVSATNILGDIWVDLLIECKYRHDGTRWIFPPEQYFMGSPDFTDVFVTLDRFADTGLDSKRIKKFASSYDLCGRGVELTANESNLKSISQAVSQVQYALAKVAANYWEHQIFGMLGGSPLVVIVPTIVTTAELWRMRANVSLEDIRGADELEEVADQVELLILHEPPHNELRQHTARRLTDNLSAEAREAIDDELASDTTTQPGEALHHYCNAFGSSHPSLILVVQYSRFELAMKNMFSFFGQDGMSVPKEH